MCLAETNSLMQLLLRYNQYFGRESQLFEYLLFEARFEHKNDEISKWQSDRWIHNKNLPHIVGNQLSRPLGFGSTVERKTSFLTWPFIRNLPLRKKLPPAINFPLKQVVLIDASWDGASESNGDLGSTELVHCCRTKWHFIFIMASMEKVPSVILL